ncbi:MAG: winged helix-turn-helix domain-containing protein [Sporichthyaceae bacterium]|nr:winged helix-turn-helix domain-containing protein [Sporichthyaceae bacterium]
MSDDSTHSQARSQLTLTDPKALRALAHPVRIALLEALREGPLTATQAGEIIGESPTTCSFHLRQLSRYGFVEETGGGKGRARPWRRIHTGWTAPAQPDDPEFMQAAQLLDHVLLDRHLTRLRRFVDTVSTYPAEWQTAADFSSSILHLTATELAELSAAYQELTETFLDRWASRTQNPQSRPEGARAVEVLFTAFPTA